MNRYIGFLIVALLCSLFTVAAHGATLVSPTPGSTLSGSAMTFSWTSDWDALQYWLYAGSYPGADNYGSADAGRNTSLRLSNLPTDGRTIYIRLWWYSYLYGWRFNDYSYRGGNGSGGGGYTRGEIRGPAPGSTLTTDTVRFNWSTGSGAWSYFLYVGRTFAASDIAAIGTTATDATVSGLPLDGSRIYVRLWTYAAGTWLYQDVTYTTRAAGVPAQIYYPSPGTTLVGSSTTFAWSGGSGITGYCLSAGSAPGGTDLYSRCLGLTTSGTVSAIPTDGRRIYVRLTSQFGSSSQYRDVTYTASTQSTQFRLSVFPLPTQTYSTAQINSVFDHAASQQYCPDGRVVAYTGEEGLSRYGSNAVGNISGCGIVSGFANATKTRFSVGGQYNGAGTPTFLFYDGHPGYDYRTVDLCPVGRVSDICPTGVRGRVKVRAAATGKVKAINTAYGRIEIDHGNSYETWYMHLDSYNVKAGAQVTAGDVIGIAGERGAAGSPHLHFEVRYNGVPVDPYGWRGGGSDPYTRAKNITLW
ncbi:MAG TPA: M23 family metallopeptidase [Thermoanaerobaculia bacterium]|nr:M23 family metallopeptidase [Thermoanaerobaculia bacterium]